MVISYNIGILIVIYINFKKICVVLRDLILYWYLLVMFLIKVVVVNNNSLININILLFICMII